jgi:hypothetical protein
VPEDHQPTAEKIHGRMAVEGDSSGIKTVAFQNEVAMDSDFEKLERTLSMNLKRYRAERGVYRNDLRLRLGLIGRSLVDFERCLINPTLCDSYEVGNSP